MRGRVRVKIAGERDDARALRRRYPRTPIGALDLRESIASPCTGKLRRIHSCTMFETKLGGFLISTLIVTGLAACESTVSHGDESTGAAVGAGNGGQPARSASGSTASQS